MSPMTTRNHRQSTRAVVIGAGVAGLCAARALAGVFDEVCVLERRQPSSRRAPRDGMVHGLLARGSRQLEALFPGLDYELARAGASLTNAGADWLFHTPSGPAHRGRSFVWIRGCTRALLVPILRRRVAEAGIRMHRGLRVTGLQGTHAQVRGVRTTRGDLEADLVVDASGTHTHCGRWLAALGHAPVAVEEVPARVEYLSQLRDRPRGESAWRGCYLMARPPTILRSVLALPVEDGRVPLGLAAFAGRPPDPDQGGAWVDTLSDPAVGRTLFSGAPRGPVHRYTVRGSRRRRPEKLATWPGGLVMLGDAHCAPNPIYGQGMTVAAMSAGALCRATTAGADWRRARSTRRLQAELSRLVDLPWRMATWQDRLLAAAHESRPPLGTRLLGWLVDAGFRAATRDRVVRERLLEVLHLLRPAHTLLTPRLLTVGSSR